MQRKMFATTYIYWRGVNRSNTPEMSKESPEATAGVVFPDFPLFFTLSPLLVDALRKVTPRAESVVNTDSILCFTPFPLFLNSSIP